MSVFAIPSDRAELLNVRGNYNVKNVVIPGEIIPKLEGKKNGNLTLMLKMYWNSRTSCFNFICDNQLTSERKVFNFGRRRKVVGLKL